MSPSAALRLPPPVMADAGAGERLRAARHAAGMTVEALAGLAGIDKGHLSRIETGRRPLPERLARELARHLGTPAWEIVLAGGQLPSEVAGALAGAGVATALDPGRLSTATLPALRRHHLSYLADEHAANLGAATDPPRLTRLLASAGIRMVRSAGEGVREVTPGHFEVGTDIPEDHHALIGAHLVAHRLLEHAPCDIAGFGTAELEATAMASFLLAPRAALRSAALRLRNELGIEPYGDVTALIGLAAERFGLPVWVMARRLGEDGLLAEMVEVGDL
jgi:transcriptional regulator with XRE-family HTH domain